MDEYYTWYVGSVWNKYWPEFMYVGQWPIIHGPVILPYMYVLKTSWWAIDIISSMWCKDLPHLYVGQWPTYLGPVILPYILKSSWWTIVIIGILIPCDAKNCLIKSMWVSDLHFMVQWLCLISWSCTGEIDSVWHKHWPKIYMLVSDLYFMVWWFCLIFLKLFDGQMS